MHASFILSEQYIDMMEGASQHCTGTQVIQQCMAPRSIACCGNNVVPLAGGKDVTICCHNESFQ